MEKKCVIFQGEQMIEGWPEKIQEAQEHPSVVIRGKTTECVTEQDWTDMP